jgi:Golgi nucleoside diphosphatase
MTNAKLSINNLNQKSTFRGMVIDAGSGGSTLHIYSWKLQTITNSPSVSVPEANEIWTGRVDPGISTFFENPEHIITHLGPLLEFAKSSLVGLEDSFHYYPIYFKATAGMRELESNQREFILQYVRIILSDKKVCPFYFENDFARVITSKK